MHRITDTLNEYNDHDVLDDDLAETVEQGERRNETLTRALQIQSLRHIDYRLTKLVVCMNRLIDGGMEKLPEKVEGVEHVIGRLVRKVEDRQ